MELAVIAHDQTPTIVHPSKAAHDFPAISVTCACANRATAFGFAPLTPLKGGNGRFDARAVCGETPRCCKLSPGLQHIQDAIDGAAVIRAWSCAAPLPNLAARCQKTYRAPRVSRNWSVPRRNASPPRKQVRKRMRTINAFAHVQNERNGRVVPKGVDT